ncbi:MAG: hypothetical protein IKH88_03990 [Prevotella sp.]|nr:hypothetical protein [Prevotella sp.]
MKKPFALFLLMTSSLPVFCQGTAEDYARAYSLSEQFKSANVRHWAHGVKWRDSTHVLTYWTDTDDGPKYHA